MTMTSCAEREDQLALLAGGDLAREEALEVNLHLASCTGCRDAHARIHRAMGWAKGSARQEGRQVRLTDDDRRALRARIVAKTTAKIRMPRGLGTALALGTAAAVAVLVAPLSRKGTPVTAVVATTDSTEGAVRSDLLASNDEINEEGEAGDLSLWGQDEDGATPTPGTLRIDLRTQDPQIRIIWLARK